MVIRFSERPKTIDKQRGSLQAARKMRALSNRKTTWRRAVNIEMKGQSKYVGEFSPDKRF